MQGAKESHGQLLSRCNTATQHYGIRCELQGREQPQALRAPLVTMVMLERRALLAQSFLLLKA